MRIKQTSVHVKAQEFFAAYECLCLSEKNFKIIVFTHLAGQMLRQKPPVCSGADLSLTLLAE